MSTVDERTANKVMSNDGYYDLSDINEYEPRCVKIVKYTNAWGGIAYGLIHNGENKDRYHESDYVINPKTIWEYTN